MELAAVGRDYPAEDQRRLVIALFIAMKEFLERRESFRERSKSCQDFGS